MSSGEFIPNRSWWEKFRDAFRGVYRGIRGQSSFAVHLSVAGGVLLCGAWLNVTATEWCLLLLSITIVVVAELFNSALELLAKAVDRNFNPLLGAALDIASGAVLLSAIGASAIGLIIFLPRLAELLMLSQR